MNIIKNLNKLGLDEPVLVKMEHAAIEHKRWNNITFKIVEADPLIIQVTQGKNAAGAYHDQKRLIEIVHETFDRFFPDQKIKVHPIPYVQPESDKVDPKWINEQMLRTGTRLKHIAEETGIDYTHLSALVNGSKPLSAPLKALFYFYFKTKKPLKATA